MRTIDSNGQQLGIMDIRDAVQLAKDQGLDLIQITEKLDPPVCKILEYGKYLYSVEKKERATKKTKIEHKVVKLKYNTSDHDLETKAKQVERFLKKGYKINVQIFLRGREKAFGEIAKKKIMHFLDLIRAKAEIKIEQPIKRKPTGFSMIIARGN